MSDGTPTLKQRLENHAVWVVGTIAIAAFFAGYGMRGNTSNSSSSPDIDWQVVAKEKGWIDKNLCPAMPVVLRILSPGRNATVDFSGSSLRTDLVINASQPLPAANFIGFVTNIEGDPNYYVRFPSFDSSNEQRTVFRESTSIIFPRKIEKPSRVDLWAIMIDDKSRLGSIYGNLDDIKSVSSTVVLSEMVGITVVPKM